ncbi:MAG: peptide chain release factor N(5)-glutamine methyltransferase [Candidatus Sulfotelmatobacter sp.]
MDAVLRLTANDVPSPRMNAEILLMFTLASDRAYLYAHPERKLTAEEGARYDAALAERIRGVPAQYITGHQEFWGLDFIVTAAVLIPRPETEHVIEAVLELAAKYSQTSVPAVRIADIGTGSGCIAVAIAHELTHSEVYATDISPSALEIAGINVARHQLLERIRLRETNLISGFDENFFDFVVSNPPYVGESEEDTVQLEVRKFEPRNAVFAGPTGLEIIARLIPQARLALRPNGWLVMEISGTIVDGVKNLLQEWRDLRVVEDLQGIARVVAARKPA